MSLFKFFKKKDEKTIEDDNEKQHKHKKVDISSLPVDPAERPSLDFYHVNQRDEIRRTYLQKGHFQPQNHKFRNMLLEIDLVGCNLNHVHLSSRLATAHVGDFGLARLLGINSNQNSTSGIRGTIGYAPPEYGVGSEMISSGDVYSFGILLLEVMTRKRLTDNIFIEGHSLHKFAKMALPDHLIDVIDDDLLDFLQEDANPTHHMIENAKKLEECLASTVKIGVSCSVDSPAESMNIENVVHQFRF